VSADDGETIQTDPDGSRIIVVQNALPDWVYSLRPLTSVAGALAGAAGFLVAFAQDPVGFIVMVIRSFIIGSVLQAGAYVTNAILGGFAIIVGGLRYVQRTLVGAFGAAGVDILGVLFGLQEALAGIVAGAGPAGPVIAVLGVAVSLFVLYRLALAGLEFVPGGSSLLTLLRLR
jgi:hypothetical protein